MASFLTTLFSLLQGLLITGLLGVGFLLALVIFRAFVTGLSRRSISFGSFGLSRYHRDTLYSKRLARSTPNRQTRTDAEIPAVDATDSASSRKPVAVLTFNGDIMASDRQTIARQIDEVVINKGRLQGAVVILSSPGGGVAQYGQLYAEMERFRKENIDLTVCVDTVAASGGYLGSLPANRIIAAPFAMVGSIGVVAQVPNYRKLLERLGVDYRTFTAGKYKRTVTTTGEDTPEAVAHFKEQLEAIHKQFTAAVTKYRKVDPDKACTGAHWTAQESMDQGLNLVDELGTSQEFLFKLNADRDLIFIGSNSDPIGRRIGGFVADMLEPLVSRFSSRFGSWLQ
ncbi:MAG: S49 family peptidase [Candidatus Obscuribacterales bacterium]|nr:S49 family peptidase [Candidatus Obscuribacterales bacterium]